MKFLFTNAKAAKIISASATQTINFEKKKIQLLICSFLLILFSFESHAQGPEAIDDNGTNVGVGTDAPSDTTPSNNLRLNVYGGERTTSGTQTAQSFTSSQNYLGTSYTSGFLGHNYRTTIGSRAIGVNGNINVSDAKSTYDARPSENYGGKFLTKISAISGNGKHFIAGVSGILSGRWEGEEIDGFAGAVIGLDNINGASTFGGYFKGKLKSGDIRNPRFTIHNENDKFLELAVASCNGCYSSFAEPGDAVFRVLGGGDMIFGIPGTDGERKIIFATAADEIMTVQEVGNSGKVGIGTTEFPTNVGSADVSDYKLFVEGGVLTEEVRVRTGWADYVFNTDYKLKSLADVEAFISENGHLPNVPSAKEVESSGLELGDISRIQQEKIEELTLYIIDQQKQINELKTLVHDLIERK